MATVLDFWGAWLPVAGAAMGLTVVIISIIWMLSELLQNDKMKGWAKMELVEVFYSAIILSMAITGLPIIDNVIKTALIGDGGSAMTWVQYEVDGAVQPWQLTNICNFQDDRIGAAETSVYHGVQSCHMRLGIWYLREIFDEAKRFAFDIYLSYIFTSMLAEFTINIEFIFEKAGFFTFTPWKGFFTMGNTIKAQVFDWAIKIMMITKFQEILLRFIAVALFPALFVMGVILRTFAFTRRLGGLLLAMALALYFFYPAFYAFGAIVMMDIKNDPAVRNAWLSPDNPANPGNYDIDPFTGPEDYPNPPIANTMYMQGNFSMIGGDGNFNTEEASRSLERYEGYTDAQYFNALEQKEDGTTFTFNLGDRTAYEQSTDEERKAAYQNAYSKGLEWFNDVSKENKFDRFVTFAWEPNGPIDTLSRITFWSLFFSFFSIIGTIAVIRSLSITFGGDIEIAGLTRLI
ncbi:hypothetical protein JXA56_02215 [Candidatus Micrarchaeota archaeon]|nr:hypothetical protein [Candidatus Micrarchaeota archaeon]